MEAKDWLTLLTSWVAIFLAGYSLYLHSRRDKRERASTQPLFSLKVSCPPNIHIDYAAGNFSIESRQEDELIVEELKIIKPRDVRFVEDLPTKPWKLLSSIPINVKLSKGESYSGHFFTHPIRRLRVTGFYFMPRYELLVIRNTSISLKLQGALQTKGVSVIALRQTVVAFFWRKRCQSRIFHEWTSSRL
jgi:hypothetical protein